MNRDEGRHASLRRVIRETRTQQALPTDWQAVEDRLVRYAQSAPLPAPRRSLYPLAWTALAAAAAIVLWLVSDRAHVAVPRTLQDVTEATQPLLRDGNRLEIGARIVAGELAVLVTHAARATWTLSPASSALLLERGERIRLRLETGSVLSEVVPSPSVESFVVEAANARIAVHGTVFRIALVGDRVIVNVHEGIVAVGALRSAPAFILKAPAYGDFALDGRSGSIDGRPLAEKRDGPQTPRKFALPTRPLAPLPSVSAPSVPAAPAPEADGELPLEPSISDIEQGVAGAVDSTTKCFSQNTKSADGVQITVRTALSLQIAADGSVSNLDFQPPLSPEVDACARSGIATLHFAPSLQGAKVTRMLELKR